MTSGFGRLPPEIEKIKPIVGIAAAVALEDGGIALNRRPYRKFAASHRGNRKIRDRHESYMIPISAAVQAHHKKHRTAENRRGAHGPGRYIRLLSQELHGLRRFFCQRS